MKEYKLNYKLLESNIIYKGRVFDIKVDKIEYESGNESLREIALHNGGAVILAVSKDNKILLVEQFRYPFEKRLLELPAGKLEINEDPLVCAKRELTEETGYSSSKYTKLGAICTTPGFCSEILHIFLAEDLTPGNHNREEGEQGMEVLELPLVQIENMISSGQIVDAKTICAILYYKLLKKL